MILNKSEFTRYATLELKNLGYKIYCYGKTYKIDNKKYIVKDDEILVAIKE